jgi:methyltransferase
MLVPLLVLALAFVPMALEARLSSRRERALRAAGAREPAGDVYAPMQVIYPGCFLAMAAEAWARGATPGELLAAGLIVFLAAKALKYWAIATLGARWTFKVLVPPGSSRIVAGPYRWLRHPNYLAVAGELAGVALMARAAVTGPMALALFGGLMLARIRVEERALRG